jgi:hypothetical protein
MRANPRRPPNGYRPCPLARAPPRAKGRTTNVKMVLDDDDASALAQMCKLTIRRWPRRAVLRMGTLSTYWACRSKTIESIQSCTASPSPTFEAAPFAESPPIIQELLPRVRRTRAVQWRASYFSSCPYKTAIIGSRVSRAMLILVGRGKDRLQT